MSEKHTLRNGVIAGVLSGLILAVFFSTWFREAFIAWLHWLWLVFIFFGRAMLRRIGIPVWLLSLLTIISIFSVLRLVRAFRRTKDHSSEYTEDKLFGVVWRWQYDSGRIIKLWAFCPRCDMELVYNEKRLDDPIESYLHPNFPESTHFECEKCNISSDQIPGRLSSALNRVEREIERRLRTRECKGTFENKH